MHTLTLILSQVSAVWLKLAPVNMGPQVYFECTEGRKGTRFLLVSLSLFLLHTLYFKVKMRRT